MMLESSLGKILAAKSVEPSVSKEDAVADTTKSEAEVRIVFRFFVEEQIVFNGKIEKVKQLESEELSRIVSRIAWDGAKDEKKPLIDKEPIKNDKIIDCHQRAGQNDRQESTDVSNPTQGMSTSRDANSTSQDGGSKQVDGIHCCALDPNESLSAEASSNVNACAPVDRSPHIYGPTVTSESDNQTTASISTNNTCRKDMQLISSYQTHDIDEQPHHEDLNQDNQQATVITATSSSVQGCELVRSDDADAAAAVAAAENQMIVEALYDCVYNVDLESRKSDQKPISDIGQRIDKDSHRKIEDGYNKITQGEHNEQPTDMSKELAKSDKKPLMEAANVPFNNEITQVTISSSDNSFYREKDGRTHQVCKDDLNLRLENSKKSDMNVAARRRNTCDNATPNRRIRRSGSKDQRTSKISSSDRFGENALERHDLSPNEALILPGEHLTRQSKVFAKWSDNHFYPGTILKPSKDRKFEIAFVDGARKDIVETDLIPLSNIINKQVRVSIAKDYCVNAQVHEKLVAPNGQPMFNVEYQQNGLVKKCVPFRDIFLTAEQGIPLINQPTRPDKNPDESMFAGVDLDNIVHVKRSRRLQEMEDLETSEEGHNQQLITINGGRKKRGQYNMRNTTNRARASNNKSDESSDRGSKKFQSDANNQDTPISSCSPDDIKSHLQSSNINPPSDSSSSTGSTTSASNVHEMSQEFYFESSSPHRTKTSLLL